MDEKWTKERIFDKLDWEGGTWEGICGYGLDSSILPDDAPAEVRAAWDRVRASREDIQIIDDWLQS